MKKFVLQNRRYFPILLILLLATFLRLYRISDYMTFLGDEGRDALVWLHMVRDGKFTLLGPMTSIGNMYLGPLYYYLMLPFFIIFQSPVGPSVGVALFSVLTVYLLWQFGKEWFNETAGLIAALLYSISPVVISLSRSSWNPNVMPFFALLTIWGVWQFWQKRKWIWLPIIGISLSFAIQSHYLGLLLIPVVGIFWLVTLRNIYKDKQILKRFLVFSFALCALFFALSILPLVWFDLRHNFINFNAFKLFFTDRQATVNFKIYKAIPNLWPLWETVVTRLLAVKDEFFGKALSLAIPIMGTLFIVLRVKSKARDTRGTFDTFDTSPSLVLLLSWLIIGLVGLGLYKQHIYDHYFEFIYPAVFLLAGFLISKLFDYGKPLKFLGIGIIIIVCFINFQDSPLKYAPNSQLKRVKDVDQLIIQQTNGKPFNFNLIAKQNYDAGYSYYLEYWYQKPLTIDAQRFQETITDQLFVVCEELPCQPINNPNAGIANFGWSKIDQKWTVAGVEIYKLVHNYPK